MTSGPKSTGKPAAEMRADDAAARDNKLTVTACAFCDWTVTGTAAEGRKHAAEHRAREHPEVKPIRRKQSHKNRWSHGQDDFHQEGLAHAAEVAAMWAKRESEAA